MKKRILILLCILQLNSFLLSGCWNYTEIDQTSIIAGIAIDKCANGKKYKLTAELVDVGAGSKNASITSKVIESDGFTIMDCIRNMIRITSKKLSFTHCKILIISEEVAKDGIIPVIDILHRDQELRLNNEILISKNLNAKDIFNLKSFTMPIKSYEIVTTIDVNNKSLSKSSDGQLYKLMNSLQTKGVSAVLPTISALKINNEFTFSLSGTAVFKQDKLIGFLDNDESKYFRFIINEIKGGVLITKINAGNQDYFGAEIFENKTKTKPIYSNGELVINIETKTNAGLNEIGTNKNYLKPEKQMEYHHSLEQTLEKNMNNLIHKVQKKFGTDIFGFGNMLYLNKSPYWNKNQSNWDEVFKTIKVDVKSEVNIINSGLSKKTIDVVN